MEPVDHQNDWQNRTILLLGRKNADRLFRSHVSVIGLGGVGGIAAEMLARAGIGRMTLVDGDVFDPTNRNRQIGALISTVGRSKTDVMRERLLDINPDLQIKTANAYLKDDNIAELFENSAYCDCVLDAIDSLTPKVLLILHCLRNHIPIISSMGSGARLDPEKICCTDISRTQYCGLARAVRQRLHKEGITSGLDVIFSKEQPIRNAIEICPEDDASAKLNKKSITGTISYVPTIFGCHCAAAVIKKIISASA